MLGLRRGLRLRKDWPKQAPLPKHVSRNLSASVQFVITMAALQRLSGGIELRRIGEEAATAAGKPNRMQEELYLLNEKLSAAVWSAAAARTGRPEHEMSPSALARLLVADENVTAMKLRIKETESTTNKSVVISSRKRNPSATATFCRGSKQNSG